MGVFIKAASLIEEGARSRWTPRVSRAYTSLLGTNRKGLINYLQAIASANPACEPRLLEYLRLEKIIKPRFQDQVPTLAELKEHQLRGTITQERLDRLFKKINGTDGLGLGLEALNRSAGLEEVKGGFRWLASQTSDVVWGIRTSLAAAEYWCAHTGVITRNLEIRNTESRMFKLLEIFSTLSLRDSNPESARLYQGILDSSVNLEYDTRQVAKNTLLNAERMISSLRQNSFAILLEMRSYKALKDSSKISHKERQIYVGLSKLITKIESERIGKSLSQETLKECQDLLESFSELKELRGRRNRSARKIIKNLKSVLAGSLEAIENPSEDKFTRLAMDSLEVIQEMNRSIRRNETTHPGLKILAILSILASVSYLTFRLVTLAIPGFLMLDYILAGLLISAETFYSLFSVNFQVGLLRTLRKTKGAEGKSWYPKLWNKDNGDPLLRKKAACYIPSFNEPVGAINGAARSTIRAVLHHGNAVLLLGECSGTRYNRMGNTYAIRKAQEIAARKYTLEKAILERGLADRITAHYLSNALAVEETDLTDSECRHFTVRRIVENAARPLYVQEKKVVRLGKILAGNYDYETPDSLTAAFIQEQCYKLKIDPQKINLIVSTIVGEIASQERQARIATRTYRLLRDGVPSTEERTELAGAISDEFKVNGQALVELMENNRSAINTSTRAATAEREFFETPEQRAAFFSVYKVMERIQAVEERTLAGIITHLPTKIAQLAEDTLFLNGRPKVRKLVPGVSWVETRKIGKALASEISSYPSIYESIETLMRSGQASSFAQAWEMAWDVRKLDIKQKAIEICHRHLIWKGAEKFAEAVISNVESNRTERLYASLEFSQFLANEIAKGKSTEVEIVANFDKTYKLTQTAYRQRLEDMKISLGLMKKKDEKKNRVERVKAEDELIKKMFELGDLSVKRDELNVLLTQSFGFSAVNAEHYAEAAITAYQAIRLGLLEAAQQIKRVNPPQIKPPADIGGVAVGDLSKKVKSLAYIPVAAPGGKGARISGCINGMNVAENIGEIMRISLHRYAEESQGQAHVPQEIITFIGRQIREVLPETLGPELASPTTIAREIIGQLKQGRSLAQTEEHLFAKWKLDANEHPDLRENLSAITEEIRTRIFMGHFIEYLAKQKANRETPTSIPELIDNTCQSWGPNWDLPRRERKLIAEYSSQLLNAMDEGTVLAEVDSVGRAYFRAADGAYRLRRMEQALLKLFRQKIEKVTGLKRLLGELAALPLDNLMDVKLEDIIKDYDLGPTGTDKEKKAAEDKRKALLEAGNDLRTKLADRSFVVENAAAGDLELKLGTTLKLKQSLKAQHLIEKLQNLMIKPEGRSIRQILEDIIVMRRLPAVTLRRQPLALDLRRAADTLQAAADSAGTTYEKKLTQATQALDNFKTHSSKNYLKEAKPPASQLEYELININDADYRTYKESLVEVLPYFTERESYFFVGQRQYGRNYMSNRTSAALQSGGDAYWGFPNIEHSLSNIVHSWGSCVYHSTKAYSDNSKWLSKYALDPRDNRTLLTGNFSKNSKGDSRFVGKWAPGKEINYWTGKVMNWLRSKDSLPRLFAHSGLRTVGWVADKTVLRLADWLYNISLLQVRDTLNFLAQRGKVPEWFMRPINEKVLDNKGDLSNLEILSSQDYTTESEDIASSPDYMREMKFFNRNIKNPGAKSLYDSLYLEGIGPLGAHAEDKASNEVGFGRRWARGNEAITWDLMFSDLSAWRKIRAVSLSLFWWTGFWRPILLASPISFIFLGLTPVMMDASSVLNGIMSQSTSYAAFGTLLASNFLLAIVSFIASMRARGRTTGEAMRSMGLEYSNLTALWQSSYEGMVRGEKPPFGVTPKKKVVPERTPMRRMLFENILGIGNLLATLNIGYFMYQADGGWSMIGAGFWTLFNSITTLYFVRTLNRGVHTESPLGLFSAMHDYVENNFPNQRNRTAPTPPNFFTEEGGS